MANPEPIEPNLDPKTLEAMMSRLKSTKWPDVIGEDSWKYGVHMGWMEDMVNYWISDWDWSSVLSEMNQWDHYLAKVEGIPIH